MPLFGVGYLALLVLFCYCSRFVLFGFYCYICLFGCYLFCAIIWVSGVLFGWYSLLFGFGLSFGFAYYLGFVYYLGCLSVCFVCLFSLYYVLLGVGFCGLLFLVVCVWACCFRVGVLFRVFVDLLFFCGFLGPGGVSGPGGVVRGFV